MEAIETMNRIQYLFEKKKKNILSVFYTAGYPKLEDTIGIAEALEQAGVDMIEIGIPFSDPVADGPVIQASSKTAIENGMTVKLLLKQVKEIRKTVSIPIVLMGYLNPVMQYGISQFCADATEAGVDGLIFPDLPFDEYEYIYKEYMISSGLVTIFLISPTTSEERIRIIDLATNGFIYAVSSSSTTGGKGEFQPEQLEYFKRLKNLKLKNPFLIGFGISTKETRISASEYSNGVIVGSAFISMLSSSKNMKEDILTFVRALK